MVRGQGYSYKLQTPDTMYESERSRHTCVHPSITEDNNIVSLNCGVIVNEKCFVCRQ